MLEKPLSQGKRVAVVTGGNRGIGFETCRQLGALGYHVILAARDRMLGESAAEKLVREGLDIEAFRLDLTRADEIAALVAHVNRHVKRIDVLINNAGL
jgi:NAD(P)-dependent dehydrogenase (short-subunit alcohol dehydrogenase family)